MQGRILKGKGSSGCEQAISDEAVAMWKRHGKGATRSLAEAWADPAGQAWPAGSAARALSRPQAAAAVPAVQVGHRCKARDCSDSCS